MLKVSDWRVGWISLHRNQNSHYANLRSWNVFRLRSVL